MTALQTGIEVKGVGIMRIRMAEYGDVFATRPKASGLRSKLEAEIGRTQDPLVLIDLSGVTAFSISFGDELFAELVKRAQANRYGARRWIAFAGANEFGEEQLDQVLKNAGLATLVATADGKVKLVGEIEPRVRQAFEAIERTGEATTAALKTKLRGTSLQAVNNWVTELVMAKVVEREQLPKGSGRPYVYRAKTSDLLSATV